MIFLSKEEMKKVDDIAVERGISIMQLMENAGYQMAEFISQKAKGQILFLIGKGNNGGDGLVAARHLLNFGFQVSILIADDLNDLGKQQLNILQNMGIREVDHFIHPDWIIDCLIGYALKGNPRDRYAELIEKANECRAKIIACDLPSGMDANTGEKANPCIKADYTITLALPKKCFENKKVEKYYGEVWLAYISIMDVVYQELGIEGFEVFKEKRLIKL
jgi:NAD(P)H-hydrate epimerase